MKAAYYETTGNPDVIQYGDLPTPEPKAGEVRVKVLAASLNPIDTYIRAGAVAMQLPKPFIPGCDFAGFQFLFRHRGHSPPGSQGHRNRLDHHSIIPDQAGRATV